MADRLTIEISGLDRFLTELQQFPAVMQKRAVTGAVATYASVIRQEAIRLAPEYTGPVAEGHPPAGTLKKAIYQVRLAKECTPTLEVFLVGVRQGKKAQATKRGKRSVNLDAYYATWVEYGHYARAPHAMTKVARVASRELGLVRYVPAQPFMRPAVEKMAGPGLLAMSDYLAEAVKAAAAANNYLRAIGV